ncbi:MAG: transaldolase [Spirochaetota bacterium]|nr:MAG: transaldolase [Spirochaetota bacterium]
MEKVNDDMVSRIRNYILENEDFKEDPIEPVSDPFWQSLRSTGTELWLDTGDLDEASKSWTMEMTALTTNNTLLNNEIQKGIYDDFIKKADEIVKELSLKQRIMEIAFILNAIHGIRLVQKFGGMVSVELHTDLSHDIEGIVSYGKRFHDINPGGFIIKVPYTAAGLLGARLLQQHNVKVNFTLEFSARQNALVAACVKPAYLNVFLGRLNAYVSDNKLGDGKYIGERATIASQRIVRSITKDNDEPTRQIAASLRSGEQLVLLAGIDVFTIPPKVAREGHETLDQNFSSKINEEYPVALSDGVDSRATGIDKLWDVSEEELEFAQSLDVNTPQTGEEVQNRAIKMGCGDMFPDLSEDDFITLATDGKIPVHKRWEEMIRKGGLAIDTLLNIAGLLSFTSDQQALDNRIAKIIG